MELTRELIKRKTSADGEGFISLYNLGNQYVTWRSNKSEPEGTYWGHYYSSREIAEEDYSNRAD